MNNALPSAVNDSFNEEHEADDCNNNTANIRGARLNANSNSVQIIEPPNPPKPVILDLNNLDGAESTLNLQGEGGTTQGTGWRMPEGKKAQYG